MLPDKFEKILGTYPNFPKEGIVFKDISPLLKDPKILKELIVEISKFPKFEFTDAIVAIDARGFIFGSILAFELRKPLILARKKNKLPDELIEINYYLEYGTDSLSIQKKSLEGLQKFIIVDDLLATGGTAKCVSDLLKMEKKEVLALVVIVELLSLRGCDNLPFPIYSQIKLK